MSEAEILSSAIQAAQATAAIFSLSHHRLGLHRRTLLLPEPCALFADDGFALLSIASVALGALALNMQISARGCTPPG